MTRLRAICTAVALVCASGQVLADTASHNASAEAFLTLAHADKLGTPVYMQVQQMFAQRFEQTKAPESKKATLETYQAKANAEDQQDELEQLRKMYRAEELTTETADIVVKRALRQLERDGLVARVDCPSDRRSVYAALMADASHEVHAVTLWPDHAEAMVYIDSADPAAHCEPADRP